MRMGEEVEQSQARESDEAWRMRIRSGCVFFLNGGRRVRRMCCGEAPELWEEQSLNSEQEVTETARGKGLLKSGRSEVEF